MRILLPILLAATLSASAQTPKELPHIIPLPAKMVAGNGTFTINKKTVIAAADAADRKTADYLNAYLKDHYGMSLDVDRQEGKNVIRLTTRKFIKAPDKDGYTLTVNSDGVSIEGDTYAGSFYGVQSLIQMLPAMNMRSLTTAGSGAEVSGFTVPFVTITDAPRFAYRGMHLDVCRHFFPSAFIKKYIDYLALHKMNYFHWHLTDDQGWRIEIKKHPALTTAAAYRDGTIVGRYPGTKNNNTRYGGFYTQDEVKEIVRYAADHHITVVPEIEMPGHASAAIAAYPWLSCFPEKPTRIPSHPSTGSKGRQAAGEKKVVQETWGVFEDIFCAGKDSTFTFLEEVLDEVVPLFPSQYIHVGGDEAPKNHWKICPACQRRIKTEGLKDEHQLQSYFIQRMEKYLNAKGKTLIGWDEILEGGLAPNAVVMSWRGEKGGTEAAKQKHKVIMTPQKPVYFDHSQTKNEDSVTIGGYNPIDLVYAYEPVPKEMNAADAMYVMGAQANIWTEYITNTSKVEYHLLPRLSALSEVLWSEKGARNWKDFSKRLQTHFKRLELWGANYSKAYYDLKTSVGSKVSKLPGDNRIQWSLQPQVQGQIEVMENGKPVLKTGSDTGGAVVYINRSATYTAKQTAGGKTLTSVTQAFHVNKATASSISIKTQPNERYPGQGGAVGLVNGIYSAKGLSHPDWFGWIGDDLEATIDLGKSTSIDSVRLHLISSGGSSVYPPQYLEVLTSSDAKTFFSVGKSTGFVIDTLTMGWMTLPVSKLKTRHLKVIAKNYGRIPEGQPGAGNKAWLIADEIQVY